MRHVRVLEHVTWAQPYKYAGQQGTSEKVNTLSFKHASKAHCVLGRFQIETDEGFCPGGVGVLVGRGSEACKRKNCKLICVKTEAGDSQY